MTTSHGASYSTRATTTLFDALVDALRAAGAYNKQDQAPPAAVLWPDKERQWEPLLPRLRERLPILTLGPYAPDAATGPAYWLRCVIAGTLPGPALDADAVPILYLPGYSRQDVRAVESCPRELQPLAELQYRGILWTQRNGRDWTIAAFLQNREGGLGIEVASDAATREVLPGALVKLADELIETMHRAAPIRSGYLNGLLHPDEVKSVLRWLNDPVGFRAAADPTGWAAFVGLCKTRYEFDPEKDGPITAAQLLGQRGGMWDTVWRRFAEAPATYTAVPDALRKGRPANLLPLIDSPESWPQENETAEAELRKALLDLGALDAEAARAAVIELEREHGQRRGWVWSQMGQAPLAAAIAHLAVVATQGAQPLTGAEVADIASAYAERGWRVDQAVLDALEAVDGADDLAAVRAALQTIYRPWLEAGATAFQHAVAAGAATSSYAATAPPELKDGTCVLFSDGLRYDAARRLVERVEGRGLKATCAAGLAALPSITVTAKPSISPAASAFGGGAHAGLEPVVTATGSKVGIDVLRKTLAGMGIQVLKGDDLGDPSGRAWTEGGDIDDYGHNHGWRVAHHLAQELRALEGRIAALVAHGWRRVIVVTDHGWLLLPGGLPKADLPEHLTEVRKGRCARLKVGARTDQQVVPWRWDPAVPIAMAPGIHCYEAGREYEHGGLSPQECVVPIVTVSPTAEPAAPVSIDAVAWRGLRCNVTVSGAGAGLRADLRTKPGDPSSSLVEGGKVLAADGTAALFVRDDDREGDVAAVVVVGDDGVPLAQHMTVVGGDA
jgi:hypothetical protein